MLSIQHVSLSLTMMGWGGSIVVAARIIVKSNAGLLKFLSKKISSGLLTSSRLELLVSVGEMLNVRQGG